MGFMEIVKNKQKMKNNKKGKKNKLYTKNKKLKRIHILIRCTK